jgi:methyl-accepting chemotaxis protein
MTQQNAALVEESAAAAQSLKDQALTLTEAVGAFHTGARFVRPDGVDRYQVPAKTPAKMAAKSPLLPKVQPKSPLPRPKGAVPPQLPPKAKAASASPAEVVEWESF